MPLISEIQKERKQLNDWVEYDSNDSYSEFVSLLLQLADYFPHMSKELDQSLADEIINQLNYYEENCEIVNKSYNVISSAVSHKKIKHL